MRQRFITAKRSREWGQSKIHKGGFVTLDNDNARLRDYGLTVLRIVFGVIIIGHGYLKFFKMGIGGTTGFMGSIGVPLPAVAAWFTALAETVGGVALILGIFTLPFGLALALDLAGAIWFAKRGSGLISPNGYELELSLLAVSLAIALAGPGSPSLHAMLRRNRSTPATGEG
jgi:putative oxidoreductase